MRTTRTADVTSPRRGRARPWLVIAGGVALAAWVRFGPVEARADDAPASASTPEMAAFFETHVRPVLVERCAGCHGAKDQGGGLRVDSRAALLEGGDAGPAIVPGDPDASPLIRAVRHQGDVKMPPKKAGAKLADPVAEALAHWVRSGAPWPEGVAVAAQAAADPAATHWAYRPVVAPAVPTVSDPGWVRSPVDAFILAGLDAKHLAPAPTADKRTLIRRVTFDLTGLPPTVAEVDAFLNDEAPDAYGKVVERLLASPRYGERWGRHWLDVARYADSKGYTFTAERRFPYSYTYRDYVIRAFNEDKPYDRFVVEQIAADRLPESGDRRDLAALGFLTVGRTFLGNTNDIIDDRIDVVTRGFLGLSVACARCHDHKFDPIPTEDYYSLHGVFASSVEPEPEALPLLPEVAPSPDRPAYEAEKHRREQAVADRRADYLMAIEGEIRRHLGAFVAASFEIGFNGQDPKLDEVARRHKVAPERLRFVARRLGKLLTKDGDPSDPITGPYARFARLPAADFAAQAARLAHDLTAYLDADHPVDPAVVALFDEPNGPPADLAEVARRYGGLFERAARAFEAQPAVGPPSAAPDPALAAAYRRVAEGDGAVLALGEANVAAGRGADRILNRLERDKIGELAKRIDELTVSHPGAPPRAMVLNDRPQPGNSRVAIRGNPARPGKEAPRRFLRVLSPGGEQAPFRDGSGRLDLARAIASPANPLTARVLVNRVWHGHFGRGLVATPSDFGARGEAPSHPELLDDLAARFVAGGWSIKNLHRLIVLSSTYRQASAARSDVAAVDPDDRLVGRFPSRRLDFESMRDATLLVAGALDPAMGGRGVDLFPKGTPSTRRTVYGYVDRYDLDPTYRTFDFPSPDISAPLRPTTTVPQQALFLLNSPFLLDQARRLANRPELAALPDLDARIRRLYLDLFARPATDREVELGRQFAAADAARDGGPSPWELYAQVLLMTNEFATID